MGRPWADIYKKKKVEERKKQIAQKAQQSGAKTEYSSSALEYMITLQHSTEINVYGRSPSGMVE